ncbi:MAG: hypothetical protein ACLQVI_00360 [Polyangiaceae bacterium]
MLSRALPALFPLLLGAVSLACGSSPPPPAVVADAPPPPTHAGPKLRMTGELGEIDEVATRKTFDRVRPTLMRCYTTGLERIEYLAGDIKFYMRVKPDGHLRWVFFEQSSLGDRTTETCMLGVLTDTQWPLPDGGEAEVHQGLGFDAPANVRPPTDWSPDRLSSALAAKGDDLAACRKHGKGALQVTAYVGPAHGAGHVLAAGASAPNADAAADVDCVLGVVRGMKVPSPGSYAAKVSFSL